MEIDKKSLGSRIRSIRMGLGKNQDEFASLVGRIKKGVISAYETGESLPPADILLAISKIGNVSLEKLLTGNEAKEQSPGLPEGITDGPEPGSLTYDGQLLLDTVLAVEKLFDEEDLDPTPQDRAKIIESIYEMSLYRKHLMSTKEIRKILRLVG